MNSSLPTADTLRSCRSAEELWGDFGARLRAFIRGRVSTEEDAEDVLQEVFLKIHRQACSVEDQGKVQAWVYRIARNAIVDHYRDRERREQLEGESTENLMPVAPEDHGDVHEEILSCLIPMIEQLPTKYRDALRLADVEGLPQQEVAQRLGLSLSGAKSRIQRARRGLGKTLGDCCRVELGTDGRVVDYQRV